MSFSTGHDVQRGNGSMEMFMLVDDGDVETPDGGALQSLDKILC